MSSIGIGVADGASIALWAPGLPRPDHGDDMVQLVCDVCSAGWIGRAGEPCGWCAIRLGKTIEQQRLRLLNPALPRPGDRSRARAVEAWVPKLARAVGCDLVTKDEARRAIKREVRRV